MIKYLENHSNRLASNVWRGHKNVVLLAHYYTLLGSFTNYTFLSQIKWQITHDILKDRVPN